MSYYVLWFLTAIALAVQLGIQFVTAANFTSLSYDLMTNVMDILSAKDQASTFGLLNSKYLHYSNQMVVQNVGKLEHYVITISDHNFTKHDIASITHIYNKLKFTEIFVYRLPNIIISTYGLIGLNNTIGINNAGILMNTLNMKPITREILKTDAFKDMHAINKILIVTSRVVGQYFLNQHWFFDEYLEFNDIIAFCAIFELTQDYIIQTNLKNATSLNLKYFIPWHRHTIRSIYQKYNSSFLTFIEYYDKWATILFEECQFYNSVNIYDYKSKMAVHILLTSFDGLSFFIHPSPERGAEADICFDAECIINHAAKNEESEVKRLSMNMLRLYHGHDIANLSQTQILAGIGDIIQYLDALLQIDYPRMLPAWPNPPEASLDIDDGQMWILSLHQHSGHQVRSKLFSKVFELALSQPIEYNDLDRESCVETAVQHLLIRFECDKIKAILSKLYHLVPRNIWHQILYNLMHIEQFIINDVHKDLSFFTMILDHAMHLDSSLLTNYSHSPYQNLLHQILTNVLIPPHGKKWWYSGRKWLHLLLRLHMKYDLMVVQPLKAKIRDFFLTSYL